MLTTVICFWLMRTRFWCHLHVGRHRCTTCSPLGPNPKKSEAGPSKRVGETLAHTSLNGEHTRCDSMHTHTASQSLISLQVLPLMPIWFSNTQHCQKLSGEHICTVDPSFRYLAINSWDGKMSRHAYDWLRCGKPTSARVASVLCRDLQKFRKNRVQLQSS